ncbi:hypothetical protein M438DRAFT_337746 [Aureobasidium pullulans EXF-150]|uniref:Transmembrane protein n=1 Tax=Aureobasidium pullulans EXF-150 TaxID=1043002 RepID=A0A074XIC0_AURPU|nr:uncharacterized protein M438DRAFT_337746 [Aureobasidium pullulans EXF-150]KEQ81777.1 hypothetical protein M438DRAFT_337746 [Aureobasidium pullulans EXF-150]
MRMPSFVNKVSVPAFSYSITREYPYKWFTPVAIVGGILLTVLFSAINFFSTAYTMVSTTTTTADRQWFLSRRWPRYIPEVFTSKIQPWCEASVIPVHSYFNTNQSGFTYELLSVEDHQTAALSYYGGSIENCCVKQVRVNFETSDSRSPAQMSVSDWEVTISSWIVCLVGQRDIGLITRYGPMSGDMMDSKVSLPEGFYRLLSTNRLSTPGLYWAEQLLKAFWLETLVAITNETIQESAAGAAASRYNLSSGYISLEPGSFVQTMDIKNESFFSHVEWAFLDQARGQKYTGISVDEGLAGLVRNESWPNVWSEVDRLGKAMVSANNFDLGQQWQSRSKLNMLSTPESLQFWTANFSTITEQIPYWFMAASDGSRYLLTYNDTQKNNDSATGFFDPTASVIATTYMCQNPVLKSWANVFVSILVADLVFLRTAWSLYNLIVGYFLKSRHPDANICDDCLARKKEEDSLAKKPTTTSTIASTGMSEEVIEMNHLPAQRPSAGQHESTQSLLTHRNEESQSLLEVEGRHGTNDTGPLVVRTSPLGS